MVRTVLSLVLVTNDVRQHHFHKQKIYLLRIFPLIQPLFPLRKDYFHQNNIDLHVEIIHCIQAIWHLWSREPITTLSRPSMFMSRIIQTDYHAGQIFIPHRHYKAVWTRQEKTRRDQPPRMPGSVLWKHG